MAEFTYDDAKNKYISICLLNLIIDIIFALSIKKTLISTQSQKQ